MDLKKMYEENEDFHRYVELYRKKAGISIGAALKHMVVISYAKYLMEKESSNVQ